jgi:hypothetical protein
VVSHRRGSDDRDVHLLVRSADVDLRVRSAGMDLDRRRASLSHDLTDQRFRLGRRFDGRVRHRMFRRANL